VGPPFGHEEVLLPGGGNTNLLLPGGGNTNTECIQVASSPPEEVLLPGGGTPIFYFPVAGTPIPNASRLHPVLLRRF